MKRYLYSWAMGDTSFDAEEAMFHAPKIMERVLKNNFGSYNNREFQSLYHHAVTFGAHELTDKLCAMYPEESYHKLSTWADVFASRYVKKHWQTRQKKSFNIPQ